MDKLYNISKTAEILDVTPKTLRIWDKENKLKPILTSGGHRRYKESDINKILNSNDLSKIYLVTSKSVFCDHRCKETNLFECLECSKHFEVIEETISMSLDELINKINNGNCYITKVEKI